jgi:membrane protein
MEPRYRARLGRLVSWVLAQPAVVAGQRIMTRYSAAGGALLADGLAYAALFAIVPTVLLTIAIAGFFIGDPAQRSNAVAVIGSVAPPMHDLVNAILTQGQSNSGALGIIGLVTLAWGASRFVLSLADAVERVMGRTSRRGLLARNAAAIGSVLLLALAVVGAPTLSGIASFLDVAQANGVVALVSGVLKFALGLVPPIVTAIAILFVYRVVPLQPPSWRAVWLPGVVVGIVLTVLVQIFVFIAPRLIGGAAVLGAIAAVFATLAWLALSFQALLLGAAWVAERDPAPPAPAVDPARAPSEEKTV